MVIGMLTVLFMLGVTFLGVAQMNAKQADALVSVSPAEPVSEGLLNYIKQQIKAGRFATADGPYTKLGMGWKDYIVYPSQDVTPWLSSHWTANPVLWPHVAGFYRQAGQTNVAYDSVTLWDTDEGQSVSARTADAVFVDTGITNSRGEKYYAAMRVVDLSGLINVNTAWSDRGPTNIDWDPAIWTPTTAYSPSGVRLQSFITPAVFNQLNAVRTNTAANTNASLYWKQAGARLFQPLPVDTARQPFAISDECALRWLGTGSLAQTGRLNTALATIPAAKPFLTTISSSPNIPRKPTTDMPAKLLLAPETFATPAARQRAYEAILAIYGAQVPSDPQKKTAAHLTANLWAWVSPLDVKEASGKRRAFDFKPSDAAFTVYGVVEQLVITKFYVYSTADTGLKTGGTGIAVGDDGWGIAVELYNPSDKPVDVSDYRLSVRSSGTPTTKDLSSVIGNAAQRVVAPGGKLVLYDFGGQIGSPRQPATAALFGFAAAHPWYRVAEMQDFWLGATGAPTDVTIERKAQDHLGSDVYIAVDRVTGGEVDYNVTNRRTGDGGNDPQISLGKRDDDAGRVRALVAKYLNSSPADANRTDHLMNQASGLAATDLADVYQGFHLYLGHNTPQSLGQLQWVYLHGPSKTTEDVGLPRSLTTVSQDPGRGRVDWHGTVVPGNITYPDICAGAMLDDIFTCVTADSTRGDELGLGTRIYGKININTAPREVLRQLPWPQKVPGTTTNEDLVVDQVIDYIIAYRDKTGRYATGRDQPAGAGITSLRTTSAYNGFLSASELAIPLADYMNAKQNWLNYSAAQPQVGGVSLVANVSYLAVRDALYNAVANCVCVSSDTFAVTMRVELRDRTGARTISRWYYLAVIDRGNMTLRKGGGTLGTPAGATINVAGTPWAGIDWKDARFIITSGDAAGFTATVTTSSANQLTLGTSLPASGTKPTDTFAIVSKTMSTAVEPAVLLFGKMN